MGNAQTGRTTRQMRGAPENALYVLPYEYAIPAFRQLAWKAYRDDIGITSVSRLFRTNAFGDPRPIVIDHSVSLTFAQWKELEVLSAKGFSITGWIE